LSRPGAARFRAVFRWELLKHFTEKALLVLGGVVSFASLQIGETRSFGVE